MKLKTIEQQIIEKADKELTERIKKEMSWLGNSVANPDWHKTETYRVGTPGGIHKDVTIQIGHAYKVLELHAFECLKDRWRQNALNKFLTKVDSLMVAMEELGLQREEMQNDQEP